MSEHVLVCADFCEVALPHDRFDLVIADPPFNIGHGYDGFEDKKGDEEHYDFTESWLCKAYQSLRDGGVLAVHCPDRIAALVLQNFNHPAEWIIWHYRFGQAKKPATAKSYINSKEHLLIYRRPGEPQTFNPHLTPSDRATKYKDKRTESASVPGMRVAFDVWGLPEDGPFWGRVQGNSAERREGHPNQLPEVYVERIIRTWSNIGDQILVPFAGSGTEMVVALALDRHVYGCEISPANVVSIQKRIAKGAVRIRKTSQGCCDAAGTAANH